MAGKGNPLQFDWSISAVRSLPISVSVELEPLSPGAMWLLVITPSISTLAIPLTTTAITTRMNSSGMPPVSRNRICSGDCLSMLNVSLKPLWPTSSTLHLDLGQRIHHRARRSQRDDRPDQQAQLDAIEHSALPERPAAW